MIRNWESNRSQAVHSLQSNFFLCLTGTPIQNCLADLQSLVQLLKVRPWCEEWIWKNFLIPQMSVGAPEAIRTFNQLMQAICLRRTKDVVLSLCPKVEQAVCVYLSSKWQPLSEQMHSTFSRSFGRMRNSGEPWDCGEFFWQLGLIQQFCNHPIFVREEFGLDVKWWCSQSAKVVHLINNRGFQLCSCGFPGGLPGPGRRHFFPRKKRTCAASILSAPKSPALSQVSRRRGPRKFQVPLKHKTKPRYPHSGGATCSKNVQVRVLSCRPSCVSCDGCSWTKI